MGKKFKSFLLLFISIHLILFGEQKGWVMPELYVGNRRIIGQLSSFVSLLEKENSVLFTYFTANFSGDSVQGGDIGLGYRRSQDNVTMGIFGFYDAYRTKSTKGYQQLSLGADLYTKHFDFRINGYVPIIRVKTIEDGESTARIAIPNVIVTQRGTLKEGGLYGVDGEVGARVFLDKPSWNCPELRIYLGGYYFTRDGLESFGGPKGRVEFGFYDYFIKGSEITVGVEIYKDDLNAGEVSGVFR